MWIVILGCGSIGRRHLRKLQSLDYTELLAYDPADQARNRTKEDIRTTGYSSLDEAWARNPEVALVTAVTQAHVDLCSRPHATAATYLLKSPSPTLFPFQGVKRPWSLPSLRYAQRRNLRENCGDYTSPDECQKTSE